MAYSSSGASKQFSKAGQCASDDSKMLQEIRQLLKESQELRERQSKKPKPVKTPYGKYQREVRKVNRADQLSNALRLAKKELIGPQGHKLKPLNLLEVDDKLRSFALGDAHRSASAPTNLAPKNDISNMGKLNILQPFSKSLHKVDSYISVEKEVAEFKGHTPKEETIIITSTAPPVNVDTISVLSKASIKIRRGTCTRYAKKYARFCSSLPLPFSDSDLMKCNYRKDLWMVHFMETCYDAALTALYTPVAHNKKSHRHFGLDTGSLEAFPVLVTQVIGRLGGDPEVMNKTSLEFLLSIEQMIESAERARYRNQRDSSSFAFDGGRALLFSKFLSEEYGLDVLAVFLSARETLQKELRLPFNKVNTIMMNVDDQVYVKAPTTVTEYLDQTQSFVMTLEKKVPTNKRHDSNKNDANGKKTGSRSSLLAKKRIIPHELTHSLNTVSHTLSQSQLLLSQSLSALPSSQTNYIDTYDTNSDTTMGGSCRIEFKERVVPQQLPAKWCFMQDFTLPDTPLLGFDLDLLPHFCLLCFPYSSVDERMYFANRVKDMSAYDLIQEGTKEMRRTKIKQIPLYSFLRTICSEWKKISKQEKTQLFQDTQQASQSILSLNDIYRDRCQLMRSMNENISIITASIFKSKSMLVQLEKRQKRLLRKFNLRIASAIEQEELGKVNEDLDLERLEIVDLERLLRGKEEEKEKLQEKIDQLWHVAMDDHDTLNDKANLKQKKKNKKENNQEKKSVLSKNVMWKETSDKLFSLTLKENIQRQAILQKQLLQLQEQKKQQQLVLEKQKQEFVAKAALKAEEKKLLTATLARVVSRNAILDGTRKVLLQSYLQQQKHALLLQLGDEQALQIETEKMRLAAEKSRFLLRQKITASLTRILAPDIVQRSIKQGLKNAFVELYDPWWMLDLEMPKLVPNAGTQNIIEEKFHSSCQKRKQYILSKVFRHLGENYHAKCVAKIVRNRVLRNGWQRFRKLHISRNKHYYSARKIQRQFRAHLHRKRSEKYLQDQRSLLLRGAQHYQSRYLKNLPLQRRTLQACVRHWKHESFLQVASRKVKVALLERRFLICFYTWRHNWRKLIEWRQLQGILVRKSTITIQAIIRMHLAVRRRKKHFAAFKLQLWYRRIIAHRIYTRQLIYMRRVFDYSHYTTCQHKLLHLKTSLFHWRKLANFLRGFQTITSAVSHFRRRKSLQKWKIFTEYRTRYLELYANKISALFRMFWVFKKKVRYYKFKRAMRKLQSHVRRHLQTQKYRVLLIRHRNSRLVQRVFRGFQSRKICYYLRLSAIQTAAFDNQYSKLKFYLERYPDLVAAPDSEGNTLLHWAARGAAKRTLKLLLKSRLFDANGGNYKGYSPLHVCIMSDAVHRDELFLYMLEHGFDDDQITTSDGKTCLLLACEAGHNFIVRQLLEDGHDPNIPSHSGLTPLGAAARGGFTKIVEFLLEHEAKIHIPGEYGAYPLHEAVYGGEIQIVEMLLQAPDNHKEVDCVTEEAYGTQTPLIWAAMYGRFQIMRLLLVYGAEVNRTDGYGRTAAHYAALYGEDEPLNDEPPEDKPQSENSSFIDDTHVNDFVLTEIPHQQQQQEKSDAVTLQLFEVLREADADFEITDYEGNTPLHLSASNYKDKNSTFGMQLLLAGVYPSPQNNTGDQPSHLACQHDKVDFLRVLSDYDTHIGRRNYQHETPLGVARLYRAQNCVDFLLEHYLKVEDEDCRDSETGEILWDRGALHDTTQNWEVEFLPDNTRLYREKNTGRVSDTPPKIKFETVAQVAQCAEIPLYRKVQIVRDTPSSTSATRLTRHTYLLDFQTQKQEISLMSQDYRNANIIIKFARRKLARNLLKRMKAERRVKITILRFLKRHLSGFMRYRHTVKTTKATDIQRIFRGFAFRKHFFSIDPEGEYYPLKRNLAHRRLRYGLWSLWQRYKRRESFKSLLLIKRHAEASNMTIADWQIIVEEARRPIRVVGIYEEYKYPNTRQLKFYRHSATGACTLIKPKELVLLDDQQRIEEEEIQQFGATKKQIKLATKLQALCRGYAVRHYSQAVEQALHLCASAEEKYLQQPEVDTHVYNYALYLLTFHQDLDRARRIFVEALRRMQWRGPDIAFVLYAYAIFAMAAEDEDYADVREFLNRARRAEEQAALAMRQKYGTIDKRDFGKKKQNKNKDGKKLKLNEEVKSLQKEELTAAYGKCFDLAHQGFFRYTAVTKNNARGWELLGLCRFLIYENFAGSFDAFMHAFKTEPKNDRIRSNFRLMMTHFHGPDPEVHDEIIKNRLRFSAQLDADQEELRRIARDRNRLRQKCAKKIQTWYKDCRRERIFKGFLASVRQIIKRESRAVSRQRAMSSGHNSSHHSSRPISKGI